MTDAPLSLARVQVDEALAGKGTTFAEWVAGQREDGSSLETIWLGLRALTGVDVSQRTFYRWLDRQEQAS